MHPLLKKLQHRPGTAALVLWAPAELEAVVAQWEEEGLTVHRRMRGGAPFVLAFVRSGAEVERSAARLASLLGGDDPILWMAYPKKASKRYRSDLGRDDSWQALGDLGFEPVRQVALDADWSALRFRRAEKVATLSRSRALSPVGRARLSARPVAAAGDAPAVEEWLAALPEPRRSTLTAVHRLVRDTAPQLAPSLAGGSVGYGGRLVLRGNARYVTLASTDAGRPPVRVRRMDDAEVDAVRALVRAAATA